MGLFTTGIFEVGEKSAGTKKSWGERERERERKQERIDLHHGGEARNEVPDKQNAAVLIVGHATLQQGRVQ